MGVWRCMVLVNWLHATMIDWCSNMNPIGFWGDIATMGWVRVVTWGMWCVAELMCWHWCYCFIYAVIFLEEGKSDENYKKFILLIICCFSYFRYHCIICWREITSIPLVHSERNIVFEKVINNIFVENIVFWSQTLFSNLLETVKGVKKLK